MFEGVDWFKGVDFLLKGFLIEFLLNDSVKENWADALESEDFEEYDLEADDMEADDLESEDLEADECEEDDCEANDCKLTEDCEAHCEVVTCENENAESLDLFLTIPDEHFEFEPWTVLFSEIFISGRLKIHRGSWGSKHLRAQ